MSKKKRKLRQIPTHIFGLNEATLFGKTGDDCYMGLLAGFIKSSKCEKKSPLLGYELCRKRGKLPTLQKILEQGDAHESTRGKLLLAYKAALADSDCYIGSLADAVDFSKPPRSNSDRNYLGWIFWGFMGPKVLASIICEHGLNPPTLVRVRKYFGRLYPECRRNWPEGDVSRDKVHRTTIVRMGLPLAKDRIGRPLKVKTSS
jgi:hypothetical protein